MGKPGSSASKTFPERSEKVTSKGDLVTSTLTAPAVIFTSFCPSWIWTGLPMEFTGVSARAHEISFGKCPLGATRTRIMPFETWAIRTFHPPPYGIHDSTADRTTALIETKPIRQVELAGDSGDLYPRITQLEEPLLEDHTQDFVAQQPRRALLAQRRPEQIAARASQEFPLARDLREFEQVQRAVHGIHGQQTRRHGRAFDAKQEIGHVNVRDSPQRAAADSPIERGSPGRGKSAQGFFLSDIGL